MSIWINENTRVLVQGITGKAASRHTLSMLEYGTKIVAGTSPSKGGSLHLGVPVFNTVKEAVLKTNCDASVIFVPAAFALDAVCEAADAGIKLIVCITEHIPFNDMLIAKRFVESKGARLIGPNCPGIISPDSVKLGILPNSIHKKGRIGIVSRSGTLTYEAVDAVTKAGFGQSTAIGIGGDPIKGTNFIDVLKAFQEDEETDKVIMIGEIGGSDEQEAADFAKNHFTKPLLAFIAGRTAPKGKRMGHAGAIVSGLSDSADAKIKYLEDRGIVVIDRISEIEDFLKK